MTVQQIPPGGDLPAPKTTAETANADKSFLASRFDEAADKYRAVLAKSPNSLPAQAGLIRSLQRSQKIDEALETGLKFQAAAPQSPEVLTAMGELYYRRGEMADSERAFRKAIEYDQQAVRAYLGLAQILDALGLHRKAYDQLLKAHETSPSDPHVIRMWLNRLPRQQRIQVLEEYLTSPQGEDPDVLRGLQHYLDFLKALKDQTSHACRLARPVESTKVPMEMLRTDPTHIRGWGLKVKLNDRIGTFLVDTGATGFLLNRKSAERVGVKRISSNEIGGIGDKGSVGGYIGYVDSMQVGELEFHDCIVHVVDLANVADADGLVGADAFRSYIVGLNFREREMKLDPLPKRPEDSAPLTPSLDTQGTNEANAADKDKTEAAASTTPKPSNAQSFERYLPKDKYVAPEMKTWVGVFRFGHEILVSTKVNELPRSLFLLDTGAFGNTFSTRLADKLGKRELDEHMGVKGLNGKVQQVYRAKDAMIEFANLRQENKGTVTFDLSNISRRTGVEVSGILGFGMLNLMDLQIDYRDNLVHFDYDPAKLGLTAK